MSTGKVRFSIEVGILYRRSIRQFLHELKAEILYRQPSAEVDLVESKSLLASEIHFVGTNLSKETAKYIVDAYNKLQNWIES